MNLQLKNIFHFARTVKVTLFASLFASLLTSCNVYKSESRKNLESLGPPPNSIKTSSVNLLVVNANEIDFKNRTTYEVCRLSNLESLVCAQNLTCLLNSSETVTNTPLNQALDQNMNQTLIESVVAVDQDLLLDKATSQKISADHLICHLDE